MSNVFHFAKSADLQYIFGSPEAFREWGKALLAYADKAEQGRREWGEIGHCVAFVCCLSDRDAESEAEHFRISQN